MRDIARVTLVVLLTLLALLLAWLFRSVIMLFVLAMIATFTLFPLVSALQRLRLPPIASMLLIYLLIFGAWGTLAVSSFPTLDREAQLLLVDFNLTYERVYDRLTGGIAADTPANLLPQPSSLPSGLPIIERDNIPRLLTGTAFSMVEVGSQLMLLVFLSIYLAGDRQRFERLWLSLVAPQRRTVARQVYYEIEENIGLYLRSEILQSLLALGILYPAFYFIGFKYPLMSATIVSITWMLPLLGGIASLLWVAMAGWMSGLPVMFSALAITAAVLAWLEFWLQPRLHKRSRFGTILLLIIMMISGRVYGLIGLLIAPPLTIAIQVMLNAWLQVPGVKNVPAIETPAPAMVLKDAPPSAGDGWDELEQRLQDLQVSIEQQDVPISTVNMFARLTQLAKKTRHQLNETSDQPLSAE